MTTPWISGAWYRAIWSTALLIPVPFPAVCTSSAWGPMLDFVAQLHRMGLLPSHFPVHTHHNSVKIQDYYVWCPYTYSWQQQHTTTMIWSLKKKWTFQPFLSTWAQTENISLTRHLIYGNFCFLQHKWIYNVRKCQTDIAKRRESSIEPSAPTA